MTHCNYYQVCCVQKVIQGPVAIEITGSFVSCQHSLDVNLSLVHSVITLTYRVDWLAVIFTLIAVCFFIFQNLWNNINNKYILSVKSISRPRQQ